MRSCASTLLSKSPVHAGTFAGWLEFQLSNADMERAQHKQKTLPVYSSTKEPFTAGCLLISPQPFGPRCLTLCGNGDMRDDDHVCGAMTVQIYDTDSVSRSGPRKCFLSLLCAKESWAEAMCAASSASLRASCLRFIMVSGTVYVCAESSWWSEGKGLWSTGAHSQTIVLLPAFESNAFVMQASTLPRQSLPQSALRKREACFVHRNQK